MTSFLAISHRAGEDIMTSIAIVIPANDTIVYYDHWEDGYEADVTDPTQSTTEIWGDGNLTNGAPPGVTTDADDIFTGGTSIIVDNVIDTTATRDLMDAVQYDGRDCIQASLPIAVTRSAFPVSTGSLLGGAVEVFEQADWGRKFVAPVGEDIVTRSVSHFVLYVLHYAVLVCV